MLSGLAWPRSFRATAFVLHFILPECFQSFRESLTETKIVSRSETNRVMFPPFCHLFVAAGNPWATTPKHEHARVDFWPWTPANSPPSTETRDPNESFSILPWTVNKCWLSPFHIHTYLGKIRAWIAPKQFGNRQVGSRNGFEQRMMQRRGEFLCQPAVSWLHQVNASPPFFIFFKKKIKKSNTYSVPGVYIDGRMRQQFPNNFFVFSKNGQVQRSVLIQKITCVNWDHVYKKDWLNLLTCPYRPPAMWLMIWSLGFFKIRSTIFGRFKKMAYLKQP